MKTYMNKDDLTEMEIELLQRLAILETKLDNLIEKSGHGQGTTDSLMVRVDSLENQRHWVLGLLAGITMLFGGLSFAAISFIDNSIEAKIDEINYVSEVCSEYRKISSNTVVPEICKP